VFSSGWHTFTNIFLIVKGIITALEEIRKLAL